MFAIYLSWSIEKHDSEVEKRVKNRASVIVSNGHRLVRFTSQTPLLPLTSSIGIGDSSAEQVERFRSKTQGTPWNISKRNPRYAVGYCQSWCYDRKLNNDITDPSLTFRTQDADPGFVAIRPCTKKKERYQLFKYLTRHAFFFPATSVLHRNSSSRCSVLLLQFYKIAACYSTFRR